MALAGMALIGATLAGCGGGDDTKAYCDDVEAAQSEFSSLNSGDIGGLDKAIDAFHKLAKSSPDEVADDWKTLDGTMTQIETAFEDAGISFSDLEDMENGEIPEGADMSKLAGLATEFEDLDSDKVTKAADNISKHAKDECGVDLSE